MFSFSPRTTLSIGIISISFFPIIFYFFSEGTYPLLAVFLLFAMVSTLSLPGTVSGIRREMRKSKEAGTPLTYSAYFKKSLTFKVIAILVIISLITPVGNLLVVNSLAHDFSPSVVQSILRTETVFVSLGGILIFKESYPRSLPWVIILMVIGFVVMGHDFFFQNIWNWDSVYVFHILVAALCFGSFQVISKFIIHDLNIYLLNGLRTFMSCLLLLPWVYPYFHQIDGEMIFWGLLSALAGPFLGRNIILSCTRTLPLNYIGCNLSITPIISLGLQWIFLHNLPTNYELIGGGIILFSVLLFNLSGRVKWAP